MEAKIDIAVLAAFCAVLVVGVALGFPVLVPLCLGFLLFLVRGLTKRIDFKRLCAASWDGVWRARKVIVTLIFIGALSALWRASGTIACLIATASPLLQPAMLPVATFIVCALVSTLMGSAFGTAATAGTVCLAIAQAAGADILFTGGAALAGSFVGDRCSPISTSALLISDLTETNLIDNLVVMLKTAVVPLAASVLLYVAIGFIFPVQAGDVRSVPDFAAWFDLNYVVLLPAASVIVLAAFRVDVQINVIVSCAVAFILAVWVQGSDPWAVLHSLVMGYEPPDASMASLAGGGMVSMAHVAGVLVVSSTFSGLLGEAHILDGVNELIGKMEARAGVSVSLVVVSAAMSCVACNQTLAIMLVNQLMSNRYDDGKDFMISLENTVVTIAPLVPWSIAAAVPLASMGVGSQCIVAAFFLYLMPIWELVRRRFSARARKV